MNDVRETLRAAARHALSVAETGVPTAHPAVLTHEDVNHAAGDRIEGVVWEALLDGVVAGDTEVTARMTAAYEESLATALLAEEIALRALDALEAAGVEVLALKGVAHAHLDYDDPGQRSFGDADLLVRRSSYEQTLGALERAGFRREQPAVRGWWERRFAKSVTMAAPCGGQLDLHFAIAGGFFGARIDHARLWSTASAPFDLGGRPVTALSREGRLLHACCHLVLGRAGLRAERDLAQLVLVGQADWRHVVEHATHDRVDAVVAQAVRQTWADLQLDDGHPLARWAGAHEAGVRESKALAEALGPFVPSFVPEGRSTLAALGPLDRLLFLGGLVFPSRASMRARGRTWRTHVRRAVGGWREPRAAASVEA